MTTDAYPLAWPAGWPRHRGGRDSDSRFKGPTYQWDRVFRGLQDEIRRIGGTSITISTNQPVRNDGFPYAQQRAISDPGVAVYFMRNKKALVMAQDRFNTVIGNMRSLTMAIEGLRQMERHGGATMLERAFDGFAALPPPDDCWKILGIENQTAMNHRPTAVENIKLAFRLKAREYSDIGADMHRLVLARDKALEEING